MPATHMGYLWSKYYTSGILWVMATVGEEWLDHTYTTVAYWKYWEIYPGHTGLSIPGIMVPT